jgi:coproporphyrinogen III oxidase
VETALAMRRKEQGRYREARLLWEELAEIANSGGERNILMLPPTSITWPYSTNPRGDPSSFSKV